MNPKNFFALTQNHNLASLAYFVFNFYVNVQELLFAWWKKIHTVEYLSLGISYQPLNGFEPNL